MDWNDLRTIYEVGHHGSMAAAARALGLHPTTVARRVAQLEHAISRPLFLRSGKRLVLTPSGARLVREIEPFVDAVDGIAARSSRPGSAPIRVALTDNGARIAALVTLPELARALPEVEIELLGGRSVVDLARGEAEFALRVVEPTHPALTRRLIGHVRYGMYASASYLKAAPALESQEGEGEFSDHVLLIQGGILSSSPEATYWRQRAPRARAVYRCSSMIALATAAEQSMGLVVLPRNLARFHPQLELVRALDIAPRPLWLVMHEDTHMDARIKRVAEIFVRTHQDFLAEC